ncbi:hypothetical protein D3C87_1956690 [compost metagenome]
MKLLIKGKWSVKIENSNTQKNGVIAELQSDGNTLVSVPCADGLTSKVELVKGK